MKVHYSRCKGFTLVELLTVIAIIAVLATLLMSGLSSAKKLSRQARCSSNLHQISLAVGMYLDDYERRISKLQNLTDGQYLPDSRVLVCPSDKTGNWGGLVNTGNYFWGGVFEEDDQQKLEETPLAFSYLHPLAWENWAWNRLRSIDASAGIAACQTHGLGHPNLEAPSIYDYEGLVLRAQLDGAVVRRQVYWQHSNERQSFAPPVDGDFNSAIENLPMGGGDIYPWQLFTDQKTEQ
jgi:prepilin-type N-terminal cleavage/methylation domain-containing protein